MYVDDIKLAGKKQNIDPMWKVLNKEVVLGEPTSFFIVHRSGFRQLPAEVQNISVMKFHQPTRVAVLDHVHLGCTQRKCEVKRKTSQETQKSSQKFLEPTRKPKVIFTDNSLLFGKACEDLSWNHCTSTPHRSETNGIAERAVRKVKEGTFAVLMQSGLDEK